MDMLEWLRWLLSVVVRWQVMVVVVVTVVVVVVTAVVEENGLRKK